jgi:hypothetical protein
MGEVDSRRRAMARPSRQMRAKTASAPASNAAGRQGDRLTRPVVAELLQVSIATVRRLEGTALHPQKGPDGIFIFAPEESPRCREPGGVAPAGILVRLLGKDALAERAGADLDHLVGNRNRPTSCPRERPAG